jgi:hypothetical protein
MKPHQAPKGAEMLTFATDTEDIRKFNAGAASAISDHKRGMSLEAMARVVRPNDHPAWAEGYESERLQLVLWADSE